ncbi:AAA family ATPase [Streptococcus oralis]|uniref:Endonuclease n=2 Tax=Streptococcus TaxID=1301 RepID=A0A1L8Q2Q4_STROR|nr:MULTISPECIES: AAA family ATPase [Streptococcus]AQA07882.1 AAA domain family protein [Streptococcus oralis]MBN6011263.1 AAA family ATPase [Streptococcus oralis subsp. oralis]MCP9037242.1 AAA family ATPase [Streptococcus oralis]MCP9052348.1 AAA family ATPase [Streptococcus oralis]MCP9058472.1 AAA family ATPase [Streptococcus oralis]
MEEKLNYWMIVAGGGGKVWSLFKEESIACIDFDSNLSNILDYNNPEELKQGKQRNLFIWKFAHDIKINDYIIATSGFNKILGIGQCVKTYYFDETKTEFKHCIGVNWLKVDGGWEYQGKKGTRQTINWDRNSERINLYKSILNGTYRKNIEKVVMNKNINDYLDKLRKSKNLILRGAPGTGKTYLAKEIAKELTGGNEDQIEFVQFHPSYDYTDFVEGLRPILVNDGQINFGLQDGIFKKFCQKAKEAQKTGGQDNFEEAWDLYLEYVNSRDEKEYLTEFSYLTVNSRNNFNINYETKAQGTCLTKSYVYELYKDEKYLKQPYYRNQGKKVLETLKKRFGLKDYISPTEIDTDKKFVFIIDEINRGEISKIFGELFFSIDPGYRGEKGSVSTQYANLHETDEKFYIPENVYIIGTMNDIDRSVDTFDFAMRRRFRFVEVTAESQVGMLDEVLGDKAEEAKLRLRNLNAAIENVQELNSHYHIGPSYFLKLKDVDFDYELLWSDYLKPLLEDYLRGSYEEAETLDTLKKAFDLTNNEQTVQQDTGDDNADN